MKPNQTSGDQAGSGSPAADASGSSDTGTPQPPRGHSVAAKPEPKLTELAASELKVGHCVIINHFDRPCTRHVAVIIRKQGSDLIARYLNAPLDEALSEIRGSDEDATPINHFGVAVYGRTISDGTPDYRCDGSANHLATALYKDGKPRHWQDYVLHMGIPMAASKEVFDQVLPANPKKDDNNG